jgi:hypothetical protein
MIEALDAFAVRAKLTGSNTAMGRFMVQLFGSKKEPWVEGAGSPERTEISVTDDGADAVDNEKTQVVEDRDKRAPSARIIPNPSVGRQSGNVAALQAQDAAHWQEADHRPSNRLPAQRPQLPFESRTPPGGNNNLSHEDKMAAATLAGTGMPMSRPMSPPPEQFGRMGSEPQSDPGAQPLVNDEKLGWSTGVSNVHRLQEGGSTRVATSVPGDYKIKSNRGWIILVVLMALALGAGIAIANYEQDSAAEKH